jgi:hypothetical protein
LLKKRRVVVDDVDVSNVRRGVQDGVKERVILRSPFEPVV